MVAHLLHFKGKGGWVLGLPLAIAVVLFIFCDAMDISTKYNRPLCLIISSVIIWFVDKGPELLSHGKNGNKGLNTFMWIDMKFWAIVLALIGFVCLRFID